MKRPRPKPRRIEHPDWLYEAVVRINSSVELYKAGSVPKSIEVFMVRTPLLYALRSIYGSDLSTAWHLLLLALGGRVRWRIMGVRCWWYLRVKGMTEEQFLSRYDKAGSS